MAFFLKDHVGTKIQKYSLFDLRKVKTTLTLAKCTTLMKNYT